MDKDRTIRRVICPFKESTSIFVRHSRTVIFFASNILRGVSCYRIINRIFAFYVPNLPKPHFSHIEKIKMAVSFLLYQSDDNLLVVSSYPIPLNVDVDGVEVPITYATAMEVGVWPKDVVFGVLNDPGFIKLALSNQKLVEIDGFAFKCVPVNINLLQLAEYKDYRHASHLQRATFYTTTVLSESEFEDDLADFLSQTWPAIKRWLKRSGQSAGERLCSRIDRYLV